MSAGVIVRISRGHFTPENYGEVRRLIEASARTLVPVLNRLTGLIYFHAAVDVATNTVVNISLWTDLEAAKQMDDLAAMQAQRPILELAGVRFDPMANYNALWRVNGIVWLDALPHSFWPGARW